MVNNTPKPARKEPVIELPEDIKRIANPEVEIKLIDDFITCAVCFRKMHLGAWNNNVITFGCVCGYTVSVPACHHYFINPKEHSFKVPGFNQAPGTSDKTPAVMETKSPVKLYDCKDCEIEIGKEQAVKSFELCGRALCPECMGAELCG